MEPDELVRRRSELQIVDVRESSEWETGRIPWAIHIPLDRISTESASLDPGRPVVTVCRTGPRSQRAADALRAAGFTADHLAGGVVAWEHSGRILVDAEGRPGSIEGHDHSQHGHDNYDSGAPMDPDLENFQDDFLQIAMALNERFGDREPTDDEAKAFMREWLQGKGTPDEEIDRILSD